ncbi:MAG: guanylate kinase [bacterium]|nr:MAG: guanylate kinase [bacterium]
MTTGQGRGILFVLSAPSGAGKTTIAERLVSDVPCLKQSVSYTTRPIRGGEVNGGSYVFVDEKRFRKMIDDNRFVEWAKVHGMFYGTALDTLEEAKKNNLDLLLVIDVQGAAKLREKDVDALFIFVLPPSMKELERRLRLRGSEDEEGINSRLLVAKKEIKSCRDYDYIIVNDDLEKAQSEMISILESERIKRAERSLTFPDYRLPPCGGQE